jgi:uncharacterized protein (UPF0335 family)
MSNETAEIGHNSVAGDRIKAFIERVERLEEEKKSIAEDIKEVYAEAKGVGFDVKTIKTIVKMRKIEEQKRAEEQALLETYMNAIQMSFV